MAEENQETELKVKFPKIEDYEADFQKGFGNIIFFFTCEIKDKKLRLGLKEINALSPYYFESFYTLDDLKQKSAAFNMFSKIDDCVKVMKDMFKLPKTKLMNGKKGEDMVIHIEIPVFTDVQIVEFNLEKKTLNEKDDVLMSLYQIEKKNADIFKQIKECCEDSDSKDAKEILKLLG